MKLDERLNEARHNLDIIAPVPPDLRPLQRRAARPASSTWVALGAASLTILALVGIGARLLSDPTDTVALVTDGPAEPVGPRLLLSSAEVPSTGGTLAMLLVDAPAFTVHDKPIEVVRVDNGVEEPQGWLVTAVRPYPADEAVLSPTVPRISFEGYGGTTGGVSRPLFVGLPPLPEGDYELRLGMSDSNSPQATRLSPVSGRFAVRDGASLPEVSNTQDDLRCSPALVTTPGRIECDALRGEVATSDTSTVRLETWRDGAWLDVWSGSPTLSETPWGTQRFSIDVDTELPPGLVRFALGPASDRSALIWLRATRSAEEPAPIDAAPQRRSARIASAAPLSRSGRRLDSDVPASARPVRSARRSDCERDRRPSGAFDHCP